MSSFPPNWPTETDGHFFRYRKTGNLYEVLGPYMASRASVVATATYSQQTGITIDADERLVFDAGADVKEKDIVLRVETNEWSTVVEAHIEPGYVEAFTKATNKPNAAAAPWSTA